jgi:hypothetical protein
MRTLKPKPNLTREGESLSEDEIDTWYDIETAITDLFAEHDIDISSALNILTHVACRIAVMAELPLSDLLEGTRLTYEHTVATIDFTGEIQ